MKITFVVPALNLTGGLRVISIYAKLLSEKGHQVTVVSPGPKQPSLIQRIKSILKWKGYCFNQKFNSTYFDNANYEVIILDKQRPVAVNDLPDADFVIATFWNTAELIEDFPEEKGEKVYFIQHYEVHPWLPVERVKATFNLPYRKIVVAQWIADILRREYQQQSVIVSNAVDHKLFYGASREKNKQATFCMMYSQRAYKGSQWAFDCFRQLQNKYPETKLIVFGMEAPDEVVGLPEGAEYYYQPEQNDIRKIYSRCDAYLFTSSVEGFGLPILEAMACRTPVIGTRCGAAPDLLESGGGVLINVDSDNELLEVMINMAIMSSEQWTLLSGLAYNEALLHSWDDKLRKLEDVLFETKEQGIDR